MGFSTVSLAVRDLVAVLDQQPELAEAALRRLDEQLSTLNGSQDMLPVRSAVADLQLRIAQRNHREKQLQGLLHTAQQLLNVSALDELLDVIVRATRDLLGCDVAHLNLRDTDERGLLTLRACDGALTEAFRRQQTAPGSGITGRVVTTRSAYVAEDYLSDPLIRHDPSGDKAVAGDRLVTLAGVPLFSGEQVIGVLVASYRTAARVSSDQLGVLAAVGSLAALAVSSAQLHEEKNQAVRELGALNDVVQHTNQLLEWSSSAHDRLTGLVLQGADLTKIAAAVHELLGGPAIVTDAQGTVLAVHPDQTSFAIPQEMVGQVAATGRSTAVSRPDGSVLWVAPAVANGELLGSIALSHPSHTVESGLNLLEQRTLERAGMIAALIFLMNRSTAEAETRLADEVVDDLVVGGDRSVSAARRAKTLGFDAGLPCVVLVAEAGHGDGGAIRRAGQTFARTHGGLAGGRFDQLTVVVPGTRASTAAQELCKVLSAHVSNVVLVGASGPCSDVEAMASTYAEAQQTLSALQRLGGDVRWATPETLGFVGLLLSVDEPGSAAGFVSSVLSPVMEYDAKRGTDLIGTISAYINSGRSLRSAADALHVHPNTVLQRLSRVASLLGDDWQQVDRMLEVQLALKLYRLYQPL